MATQRQTRRTRIVVISDTHNQTPKLPKGDVLIHAGDLTNQGSFEELEKSVGWLENANFERKIVVAGNHDITLDAAFYDKYHDSWKWPRSQNPQECRKLFALSPSITYLEHGAATIYLTSPSGPQTNFKIFGSPFTPKQQSQPWAFQYSPQSATALWFSIPRDADIVVTHTPPKGHCDKATKDDRTGCEALLRALHRVRPLLAVCGHIHEARGAERVRWNTSLTPDDSRLVKSVGLWEDPGAGDGSKKQSLVDLTGKGKGGRRLENESRLTRQTSSLLPENIVRGVAKKATDCGGQPDADEDVPGPVPRILQPSSVLKSTSPCPAVDVESEAKLALSSAEAMSGRGDSVTSDMESRERDDVEAVQRRRETAIINAAFLGPRIAGKTKGFNKPIVIDIVLPVWNQKASSLGNDNVEDIREMM